MTTSVRLIQVGNNRNALFRPGKTKENSFTYKLWKESHFSASYVAPEKSWKLCIVCLSLFGIINNQIMKIEAKNFTACNLTQKLVCLEDNEGGKFVVVYDASAESVTDKRFLQSLKKDTRVSSSLCWLVL